jgi:hypothetical protein
MTCQLVDIGRRRLAVLVGQMLLVTLTKEAADKNDLHSLFSKSLFLPFRLAERLTASPFLNQPSI